MPRGKIRIKALIKFLNLCISTMERNRPLTLDEIILDIHCSKGHAYNYRRALGILFPQALFDRIRERRQTQQCLTT
jgi:hypothetical protein